MEKFSKILKFADKDGNKHSYMANFIDGEISPEDKRNIEKLKNGERLEEKKETSAGDNEIVNDFSIDAIKDNFTPPGAKDEDDYNPQSEVRYTSPEELKLSEMSEEDLKQGLEDIKRGVTDYTDAEEPIVTSWIKDEMKKRKSAIDTNDNGKIEVDEMADFQKSLDDYASKNKKGRDDIPTVTTRR